MLEKSVDFIAAIVCHGRLTDGLGSSLMTSTSIKTKTSFLMLLMVLVTLLSSSATVWLLEDAADNALYLDALNRQRLLSQTMV